MATPAEPIEIAEQIRKQARAALTAGIIGIFFFGIIFGTGALIRAAAVRRAVKEHGIGEEHLKTAKTAAILGAIALVGWSIGMVVLMSSK